MPPALRKLTLKGRCSESGCAFNSGNSLVLDNTKFLSHPCESIVAQVESERSLPSKYISVPTDKIKASASRRFFLVEVRGTEQAIVL